MSQSVQPNALGLLLRDWRGVAASCFLTSALALGASFLIRDKFTATVVILPPQDESVVAGLLTGVGASPLLSRALGLTAADGLGLYSGVVRSRTVADELIRRFDLVTVYRLKDIEKAERQLRSRTGVTVTPEEFLRIEVRDEDRQRAADLANAYVEQLDGFLQENMNRAARLRREYLDRRLADSQSQLRAAEDRLRDFGLRTRLPVTGADASVDALGGLLEQKTSREIELGTLARISRSGTPRTQQLREEISQINRQIDRIPAAANEGGRLLRNVRILERIVLVLTEERERARMLELQNVPTVEIVDHARAPLRKSEPRRALIVVAAFVLALGANAGVAWVRAGGWTREPSGGR